MTPKGPNPYLKTRVMTASPEELRLMLYDGAIKFCKQAIPALHNKDYETSYEQIARAQRVVLELSTSLNSSMAPEICDKLAALYTYIYKLLISANTERRVDKLDEATGLLEYERSTWIMLMDKLKTEGNPRPNGYGNTNPQGHQAASAELSKIDPAAIGFPEDPTQTSTPASTQASNQAEKPTPAPLKPKPAPRPPMPGYGQPNNGSNNAGYIGGSFSQSA